MMHMTKNTFLSLLGAASLMGLLSACDLLGGIYDDTLDGSSAESEVSGGNTTQHSSTEVTSGDGSSITVKSGQYYIDATSYTQWIYVSLRGDSLAITTAEIDPADGSETGAPDEWDFAHHRYDVKTNGAQVMMTSFHSIAELEAAGIPADTLWVADVWSEQSITVDMSHMLEGYLLYAAGTRNVEAGLWLDVDTSTMPPIYTLRDNVLIYRLADGTLAALQLVNFMSTDRYQIKGWMTVNYKYPIFAE